MEPQQHQRATATTFIKPLIMNSLKNVFFCRNVTSELFVLRNDTFGIFSATFPGGTRTF